MEETRDSLHQTMENRLDNLTRTTEKHRKRRKANDGSDSTASSTATYNSSVSMAAFDEVKAELEQYKVLSRLLQTIIVGGGLIVRRG